MTFKGKEFVKIGDLIETRRNKATDRGLHFYEEIVEITEIHDGHVVAKSHSDGKEFKINWFKTRNQEGLWVK